jgi:uncharacterized membrane protein
MEDLLRQLAASIARVIEVIAIILIAYGAGEAFAGVIPHLLHRITETRWRKPLFVRFGTWLILGLQFALAADIVRSVISPNWNDIGQLAAIAAIRTFLNFFLERDMTEMDPKGLPPSQMT